jgi:hypothetical protein
VNVLARPPAGDRRNDHTLMPAKKKPHTPEARLSDDGSLHVRFRSLADICTAIGHVRSGHVRVHLEMSALGQKRTHAVQQKEKLFDHLVHASD